MSPETDDADSVVELFPGTEGSDHDAPLTTRKRALSVCRHRRTELDVDARRVYCRDCGLERPPFDVLRDLAGEHERYVEQRKRAQREARLALGRLRELERQERNAKGRVRRARAADPSPVDPRGGLGG